MDPTNIDDQLLSSMGDLSGVIAKTPYQAGSPDALPEGTNLSGAGDPRMPADAAQYLGNATSSAPPGVVPQNGAGAGMDPAEAQRLHQIAYDASLARIEAEEAAFQASIEHLPDDEKLIAALSRELEQTREVNSWLNTKQEERQATEQATVLRQNKNQWIVVIGSRAGLPIENQGVWAALDKATSVAEMQQIAASLGQVTRGQAVRQTVNTGILAPGGRAAPAAPRGPKPRSGDLAGLIASRNAVNVTMG